MSPALGIMASGYMVPAAGGGTITPPNYIQGATGSFTTLRTVSVTFSSGVLTGDLIYFHVSCTQQTAAITIPSGWVNVLSGNTMVLSSANAACGIYHIVTSGENGTTAFSATNLFNSTFSGSCAAVVFRGTDPTTPIDAVGTSFDSTAITAHVLAAITGTGGIINDNSVVVRGVSKDSTGTYTTPAGHTVRGAISTNAGTWLGTLDAVTTANTDVAATGITASSVDERCSISVALSGILSSAKAANFIAAGEYQVAATGLNGTDLTWCCWAKMVVDRVNYATILGADNAGANYYSTTTDGTREIRQETTSPTTRTLHNMVVGTWYFIAFVHNNTSGVADIYWKAAGGSMNTANRASGSIGPASGVTFRIGRDGFNSWFNGSIAAVSIWTAALNSTEIAAEADKYSPVRTSNLWANYTFKNGVQTNDESGNGRTLTVTGTTPTTDALGPPIT